MKKQIMESRDQTIIRLYFEGQTLETVGKQFGITRERVRQVLKKNGYTARRKHLVVVGKDVPKRKLTTQERFWSRVDKSGECWIWTGGVGAQGYGVMSARHHGQDRAVHRLAYYFQTKKKPKGIVQPTCRNKLCCRIDHLQDVPASKQTQYRDPVKHREALMKGKKNNAKFTKHDIQQMVAYRKQGLSYNRIAKQLGTRSGNVWDILNGKVEIYREWLKRPESV